MPAVRTLGNRGGSRSLSGFGESLEAFQSPCGCQQHITLSATGSSPRRGLRFDCGLQTLGSQAEQPNQSLNYAMWPDCGERDTNDQ